jgi:TPR repeat protein
MRLAAAALALAWAGFAGATPFGDAIEAIRKNDCATLGEVVNRQLDASTALRYLAGAMYEEGICVERDLARAGRYYAAGDERRDAGAARDMALQYLKGTEMPRSYARAGAWLAKSYALRQESEAALKLPQSIASLPANEARPEEEWAGYLVTIGFVGATTIRYPDEALRTGTEGQFVARVCVDDGTVKATAVAVRPGPSAGVASLQGKREIERAIEQGYARVLAGLPPPRVPAPGRLCFEQPLTFRIR